MLRKLAKKITNNFGLKVLAAVLAVVLWVIVAGIDDPVITQTYTTSVTLENVNYLTENGKYSELLGGNNTVTFSVSAKRSYHERLSNSDFTAVADIERIEDIGEDGICRVPITITCTKFSSSNVEISSRQLYLELAVEDLGNVQKRISVATEGTVMDGCALGNVEIVTSNLLKISGPSSVTSQIDTVVATINVDGMSSDVTDTVVPVLYDADGNEIDTSKLKMNLSTVTVTAQILNTKDVSLEFETSGSVAEGHVLKGITYKPEQVRIKGEASVLNGINKISIPAEILDMTDATETMETTVDITPYLPENTSLVVASDAKIEVTVTVEVITEKTFEVPAGAFTLENIREGYEAEITEDTIEVVVTGAESDIEALSEDNITGILDLTDLGRGDHEVTAEFNLDSELYEVGSVRVPVTIRDPEDESASEEAAGSRTSGSSRSTTSGGSRS